LVKKNIEYKRVYRVIDVNLNRAREGLRVCEDVARFILSGKDLAKKIRSIRQSITRTIKVNPEIFRQAISCRDTNTDFGRQADYLEKKRDSVSDTFAANFQRAKEAARALEEFTKLIDKNISNKFKRIRFRIYSLEKETFKKF